MKFFKLSFLLFLFFSHFVDVYSQNKKWILGSSCFNSFGTANSNSLGNLKFYEVDFSLGSPVFSQRILGNTVTSIVSSGIHEPINNAIDSLGNIAFYVFGNCPTPYTMSSTDQIYFVAFDNLTGQDQVFASIQGVPGGASSVRNIEIIQRPNVSNEYFVIYKTTCVNNQANDAIKYVVVDMNTKTISTPVTVTTGSNNEGMGITPINCSTSNRWLFFSKYIGGNIQVYRSAINSTGISSPLLAYSATIIGNSSLGQGDLEISPLGDKLAIANLATTSINEDVLLFDLSLSTGALTNYRWVNNSSDYIYSLEFSPDGQRLYMSLSGTSLVTNQLYNIAVPSTNYHVNLSDRIIVSLNPGLITMEIGYDQKLYFNKGNFNTDLYCISNPNADAVSNLISLTSANSFGIGNSVGVGFPDQIDGEHINSSLNIVLETNSDTICEGQSSLLYASGASDYSWTGGGVSSLNDSIQVTPSVTTTYYLLASNGNCQVTDSLTIYVNSNPIATINGNLNICSGESTLLTGSGGMSYAWTGGAISSQSAITVSPSQNTSYFLQVSNGNCVDNDTVLVIVNSLPSLVVSPDQTICSGQSTTISASGGINYSWTGGVNSSASSLNVSPTIATYYYVEVSDANCSQMDTVFISVDTVLTPSITGQSSVCQGQNVVLSASGGGAYSWSGGTSSSSATVNVVPLIDTYYFLSTGNSCGTYFDSLLVTVIPAPQAMITGDSSVCPGETIVLTGTGGGNYYWNGSLIAGNNSLTISPVSSGVYSLIVEDSLCSSLPYNFNVSLLSEPSVTIVGQDSICFGQSEVYSAQVASGQSPYTYLWSNSSNTDSISFTPSGPSLLSVIVLDMNGCSDTSSLNVYPINYPDALLAGEISGCAPLNATFANLSTGAATYYWDFGDGNNSSLQNPTNMYNTSGSYNVTMIAYNSIGCADTITLNSYVTVLNSPIADISAQIHNSAEMNNFLITNQMVNADSCILYFGDGQTLEGCNWQSVIHNYPLDGEYVLVQIVTNSVGCSDTTEVIIEVESESTFYAPNAFTPGQNGKNDRFNVYGVGLDEFKMMIFDRWGELIFETSDIYEGWDGTYKGKPVELGVYVWKVDFVDKKMGNQYRIGHVTVVR